MVGVVAITLDERGGGVAAVSRLVWRVVRDQWSSDARLFSLVSESAPSLTTGTWRRLQCGARVAMAERSADCEWIFYTHVSVAQIQDHVPARWRRPYGVFLHGIEAWGPMTPRQRHVIEHASLLVANSAYTAARVREQHPWIGMIDVCHLALEPSGNDASVQSAHAVGSHTVLVVGRMSSAERYKGHDELIDAWPTIVRSIPDAQLVFTGTGDDEVRLRAKVAGLGIDRHVRFTGFVSTSELTAWYRRAALFAMPSRNEGFGLVYLEAMAHGLACLASDRDAAQEVIVPGVTGLLVNPSDGTALTAAIISLLDDEPRRRQMGNRGRERAAETFSYAAFRDRFVPVLDARLTSLPLAARPSLRPAGEKNLS